MIEAQNLVKKFRSYKKEEGLKGSFKSLFKRDYQDNFAVKDFNLDIKESEIIGLLGPNGAGKTTLMKMFTGIIVPSSGNLKVLGHRPSDRDKEFRQKISLVMGQKSQLWWDIPAMDSLRLIQAYYQIDSKLFNQRLEEMVELLDVKKVLHIHVRKLSLGERMKLELIASLLHGPKIIFLDEPTIGLDLISQENIRNFIKSYHKLHNISVILTSHYMLDVSELCERLVLIFDGEKAYDGDIQRFENILGKNRSVSFYFDKDVEQNDEVIKEFSPDWSMGGKKLEIKISKKNLRKVSSHILATYPVINFESEKMPIESVMKQIMRKPEILRNLSHHDL